VADRDEAVRPTDPIARLATVDAPLPRRRPAGVPPSTAALRANTHVHVPPNFSAFGAVGEVIDRAVEQDVRVVGFSNYYGFDVYGPLAERAWQAGVFPVFGLEAMAGDDELRRAGVKINDPGNPGKMYLCGKGITRFAHPGERARQLLQTVRDTDGARTALLVERLGEVFAAAGIAVPVTADGIAATVAHRCGQPVSTVYLQERHVAQAFQEALFDAVAETDRPAALAGLLSVPGVPATDAVAVQNAIRTHLMKAGRPAYVPEHFVPAEHVHELILQLGGIPCYPVLADGADPVCAFEQSVEALSGYLVEHGIPCAELIPNRNAPQVLTAYAQGLRAAGIVVLAGTEHNTAEMVPMQPVCSDGSPLPPEVRDLFWEGTCVVAAHQFCRARGEVGYVTDDGDLHPGFADSRTRIAAFAEAGAAVIHASLREGSRGTADERQRR
jgi:hypothetical protein